MYISMNWISDFVDLSGVDLKELIGRFTLATAEVEDIYEFGKDIQDVVVGQIVSLENHPNSKKLHLLKVDNGTEIVDCVCGAPNAVAGAKVAFVKAGGRVKGMAITEAMVGGYKSCGMCCSEKELGISEDHSGIIIFDDSMVVGTNLKDIMPLEDTVFEVDNKSLTNRPDLWGHYGIARELAALLNRPLRKLEVTDTSAYASLPAMDMAIETDLCYRYSCIGVSNVTKNVSPYEMKIRLMYCGQRPINLLADLTNYLMMELGQPMHAFDKDKVGKIRVKTFDTEKKFVTLDSAERSIEPGIMMICDGDEPVAVAGIMGGLQSEIEENTTNLLLESANFDGVSVRKSATKLGMRTEASARYEKTLDPELTVPAIERFLNLLLTIDPNAKVITSLTDSYRKHYDAVRFTFDKAYVDKYTGIDISADRIEKTLTSLEFGVTRNGDQFEVVVPSFRATKDVTIKADIIEEITRIYGYDNFDLKSTDSLLAPVRPDKARENEYRIKQLLADEYGYNEVHSYIWYDNKLNKELGIEAEGDVRIVNSELSDNDVIRRTILPALLGFVSKNCDTNPELKLFEIGRVVRGMKEDGLCNERKVLSLVAASKTKSENQLLKEVKKVADSLMLGLKNKSFEYKKLDIAAVEADAELIKAIPTKLLHPKNSALLAADGRVLGCISVLNPRVADKIDKKIHAAVLEIDYADFADVEAKPVTYKELSKFPGISIDLSVLVEEGTNFGTIRDIVMAYECEELRDCTFVDLFRDDSIEAGKCSMTVRMQFVSYEQTLALDTVNAHKQNILDALSAKGYALRM